MKYLFALVAILVLMLVGCDETDFLEEDSFLDDEVVSEPASSASQLGLGTATLEIINTSGVEICDISIVSSSAEEWGDNLLDESLATGDQFIYDVPEVGSHDLLAVDCEDDVVEELTGVVMNGAVVWRIGEAVEVTGREQNNSTSPVGSASQNGENAERGVYRQTDCPFEIPSGTRMECGYLTVPENRSRSNSPNIQLAVAIRYAAQGAGGSAPIVYLSGGPGGSALDDFDADPESWDYPFARSRDLVFVDQRGTGYSIPTLDCPELNEENAPGDENPERDCRERLISGGVDLTAYNSAENAADIAALREALGYAEWDLLGISYGTRLALNLMRDFPQGIRSVILDSPFPPNADTPVDEALAVMESFETLFAGCASDRACNGVFPDLRELFLETVARLNEEPDGDFYGDDLVYALVGALNDTELIPLLPLVIYEAAQGNLDILDELGSDGGFSTRHFQDGGDDRGDSEGMYNSVICHDEYAFGSYDAVERSVVDDIPDELEASMLNPVFEIFQMCDFWGAGSADEVENAAVISDIPTLILVGEYDHATPPKWGRLTQQTLSNSYLFEFPGAGHSLLSGIECAIQISDEFLNDPQSEPDSRCILDMDGPDFQLR